MKHEAVGHPKMHDLATHLDLPLFAAHGIMEMLWHHAGDYAPDGDIGKLTNDAIARAVGWIDDPEILITALAESRWLDRNDRYRLLIHDWPDHAQEWVKKKLKRIQKLRPGEEIRWLQVYDKSHHDVGETQANTEPCPAIPSSHSVQPFRPAIPSSHSVGTYAGGLREVKGGKGIGGVGEISTNGHLEAFDLWFARQYARHPKKKAKTLAEQAAVAHFQAGRFTYADFERVHSAWCATDGWRKSNGDFAPRLAEWIEDEGYLYPPNGHAPDPSPHETPEQMRAREAKSAEVDEAARATRLAEKRARKEGAAT